jgi:hypothetical protein
MRTLVAWAVLLQCAVAGLAADAPFTRGVGIYPGDPREDFAPDLVPAPDTYRNLALHRAAYQSSAYDYNLTAQLVTDGIVETERPRVLVVSTGHGGVAPRHERELALDHSIVSGVPLEGKDDWWQVELAGGTPPPTVDRVELTVRARRDGGAPGSGDWAFALSTSDDGKTWTSAGRAHGPVPPVPLPLQADRPNAFERYEELNPRLQTAIALAAPARARFYRVTLEATGGEDWGLAEVAFYAGGERVEVGGPYAFSSAWMSGGSEEEWVSVDLGAPATFDRVVLHWLQRAAEGEVQASDDGTTWRTLQPLDAARGADETIALASPARGRFVRVLMRKPVAPGRGYVLTELEVFGRGGVVPRAHTVPAAEGGRQALAGGAWRVQRASLVSADGAALSRAGFADSDWIVATVPGTVLSSYWNAGALPDPNFGDNQLLISDSFFHSDFWYRTELEAPRVASGKHVFLDFDGIAWKAEVFLNGERLGRIDGAFQRGRFDVTRLLRPGRNALAVRIEKHRTPGSTKEKTLEHPGLNGGALGADNPTFHASVGWDWIPPVRGRNIGIWGGVSLTTTGPVTIADPAVRTVLPLPAVAPADVAISAVLTNHEPQPVRGILRGTLGTVAFELPVTLDAGVTREVTLDPRTHPQLRLAQPRLWWPNGYGEPYLHPATLQFVAGGVVSDAHAFQAGLRQLTYSEEGGALRIWVNGRRFVARGGNWGFPESNLRYRKREYDVAVRYHRAMNFTMIRNWVGQTPDDAFYEACDRHGILVWQDFWLANPWDGPDPDDPEMFLANARDTIRRIRAHPSLGLYCGRNEGYPPPVIEAGLRAALGELHSDLHYIPDSAEGPVSGMGPYWAESLRYYFEERATTRLHSEMGMPDIVSAESLRQMMPPYWPPNETWGRHDFNLKGAQRLAGFRKIVDESYGGTDDVNEWLSLAQLVNYNGYRAMFEAQSRNRMGLLLWMSHPAWPSFVWQTYDYYFDPTAGYFGSKKGSEPLHIQWNASNDMAEVVNYSGGTATGLSVEAELLNLDGSVQWQTRADLDSEEDSVVAPFAIERPAGLTPVHFIRLRLRRGGELLSENFYWRGLEEGRYQALRTLPRVPVEATTRRERRGDRYALATELRNKSATPAVMVRVVPVRAVSRDRILPAFLDDNFVALMPGETRTIHADIAVADARGEEPDVRVEGFNVTGADTPRP